MSQSKRRPKKFPRNQFGRRITKPTLEKQQRQVAAYLNMLKIASDK